jgi:hypothetical protein
LHGILANDKGKPTIGLILNFCDALLSNISVNFDPRNFKYLCVTYEVGLEAPKIGHLQPFTGNFNFFFLKVRYLELKPYINRGGLKGFGMYDPVSFINF